MPPRYIVHVGPMKTASTYIQECLTSVQPALQERGVYYAPELIDPGNKHMHMPVYQAIDRKQAERLRPVFSAINRSGHEIVVLSCEHLIFLRPKELATLCDVIGVSDISIVYVTRRWSDRIASLWNQSLFMGERQTLPEFYSALLDGCAPGYYPKNLGAKAGRYDVDYSMAWDEIVSVVGRNALRLFSYSTVMDEKSDVFVRFCADVLGIQDVPTARFLGAKRWASMPLYEAEILRTLNAMHFEEHGKTTVQIREMMMRKRVSTDDIRLREAMIGDTAELDIDDSSTQFTAAYEAMTAYADRVVPGPGVVPGEIFKRVSRQNGYVRQDWLLQPGITDVVRMLYDKMKASF